MASNGSAGLTPVAARRIQVTLPQGALWVWGCARAPAPPRLGKRSARPCSPVQSELKEWERSPPEGCMLETCDSLTEWTILCVSAHLPWGACAALPWAVGPLSCRSSEAA